MAKGKKPTGRKDAAGKGAGKAKPRKLDPAPGQNVLHAVMLKRIAALEKTIAKLPTPPSEEIEEVKNEIVRLRALPPVPTRLPTDAVQAQAKLRKNGEDLSSLATQVVSVSVKAAVKERWASYGHELMLPPSLSASGLQTRRRRSSHVDPAHARRAHVAERHRLRSHGPHRYQTRGMIWQEQMNLRD